LCVERDFGQNSARPSSFSRSVQGRLRRIGSRRSAKIRLEIFRSLGLSVQPIASDGLDSLRLLATFTLQNHPVINFSLMEQGGRSASSASGGNWTRIIIRLPMRKHCTQSKADKQRIIEQKKLPRISRLQITV